MNDQSILYVVATPIGHLGDMVPRAIEVLQSVDVIAAEDTRHSKRLLQHFSITTPMLAYHDHDEQAAAARLIERLQSGQSIALISDAGTPLVSDPGYRLIDAALREGIKVVPIPGACAAIAALSAAGLPSDRFAFEGFPPAKSHARKLYYASLKDETRTIIFYEAPHRLLSSLEDLRDSVGGDREVVLARELTKTFETIYRNQLDALVDWVAADVNQQRGECVVLLRGAQNTSLLGGEGRRVMDVLVAELPIKQAAALAAKISGDSKNQLYQYALDQRSKE